MTTMAKRKTRLFRSKEVREPAAVAAFLRELADKIESQKVVLKKGEDETELAVGERIYFKVKVGQKKTRRGNEQKFNVKLKWVEGGKAPGELKLG